MSNHYVVIRAADHGREMAKVSADFYELVRRINVICRFVLDTVDGDAIPILAQPSRLLVDDYVNTKATSHSDCQDRYVEEIVILVIHGFPAFHLGRGSLQRK